MLTLLDGSSATPFVFFREMLALVRKHAIMHSKTVSGKCTGLYTVRFVVFYRFSLAHFGLFESDNFSAALLLKMRSEPLKRTKNAAGEKAGHSYSEEAIETVLHLYCSGHNIASAMSRLLKLRHPHDWTVSESSLTFHASDKGINWQVF